MSALPEPGSTRRWYGGVPLDPSQPFPAAGLRISDELYQAILAHVVAVAPSEGVGLLAVGPYARSDVAMSTRFYPGTNVDASATRYTMAPTEVIAAFHDIDAHGWWLGAIVHSHPNSAPLPSPTDIREAYYPNALAVIVSLAHGSSSMRAWRMDDPLQRREVPLVIGSAVVSSRVKTCQSGREDGPQRVNR